MSGLFGILDSTYTAPIERLVADMGCAMVHGEWHVVDTHRAPEACVGLGRIGIGVFNREPQPAHSDDGNLAVFLSGELYDMDDARRRLKAQARTLRGGDDLELALRLYQEKGDRFVDDLNGAFLIAVWDARRQRLIVVNDRHGTYPLYYAHHRGRLVFAPEVKAILRDPDFHKQIDLTALAEYVRFQYLLGDKTFFEGIHLLPNASVLEYDVPSGRLMIQSYWDFGCIPALPTSITFDEAAREAGRLLKNAIDRLTQGPYRLGVYLSGGVDSRAILGFIDRARFPITTITYGDRRCRDVEYARRIAAATGTRHHYFEFLDGKWVKAYADEHLALTEGFHSWIHAHGISILDQVRLLIDVNLSGFHGGELNWEDAALYRAPDDAAFACRLFDLMWRDTTWPSLTEAEERCVYTPEMSRRVAGLAFDSFRHELAKVEHLPRALRATHFSHAVDRRMYQYYTVFHRSRVEQRFPFCDYAYTDFILALPPEMNFKRKLRRAIIAREMRPLARTPYDKDDLPIARHEIARLAARLAHRGRACVNHRIARVFPEFTTLHSDYEGWLRRELREWGEELLLGERTLRRGIFDPGFLRSLWSRHQSGLEQNFIGKIAPIMTWETVMRRFYDAPVDRPAAERAAIQAGAA